MRTVLRNKWRDHLRSPQACPLDTTLALCPEAVETNPIGDLEEAEYRSYLVGRALHLMQTEFHPTIWRACWEFVVGDRPAEDVARDLGITVNAVYHAKSRVLRRLRHELQGLLD